MQSSFYIVFNWGYDMDITQYFLTQGPFAALFVWLLIWVMKQNTKREMRLHDTLDSFASKYDLVIDELKDIKRKIG